MATPLCSSVNETLAKLLKKRPVYRLTDEPVAEIVQCGEPISLTISRNSSSSLSDCDVICDVTLWTEGSTAGSVGRSGFA
jgi:hypothetical protein